MPVVPTPRPPYGVQCRGRTYKGANFEVSEVTARVFGYWAPIASPGSPPRAMGEPNSDHPHDRLGKRPFWGCLSRVVHCYTASGQRRSISIIEFGAISALDLMVEKRLRPEQFSEARENTGSPPHCIELDLVIMGYAYPVRIIAKPDKGIRIIDSNGAEVSLNDSSTHGRR